MSAPQHSRPRTPVNRDENRRAGQGDAEDTVDIRVPAWMLQFANVSINMSPSSIAVDVGETRRTPSQPPLTPSRARRNGTSTASHRTGPQSVIDASGPVMAMPAASPPRSRHTTPMMAQASAPRREAPRRTTTPQAGPFRASSSAPSIPLLGPPRPVYPLRYGEDAPIVRTLDRRVGPHGYYVVFTGLRLGIYHEYWYVAVDFSLNVKNVEFWHRYELEPYLRMGMGGEFRKRATFADALALWNSGAFPKRVIS